VMGWGKVTRLPTRMPCKIFAPCLQATRAVVSILWEFRRHNGFKLCQKTFVLCHKHFVITLH